MGLMHTLVAFTSIAVVTRILGFNLPLAFLVAGLATLIYHIATKNKLPMTLGSSGLFMGGVMYITQTMGQAYAVGGVVMAGIMYVLFGVLLVKWQDKVLKYFPNWFLSTVILLIGLSLIPIGVTLSKTHLAVALTALLVTALIDMFGGKRFGMFAMPLGLLAGTLVAVFTGGLDLTPLSQALTMEFVKPAFSWQAFVAIGLLSIAVMFEMMGDSKNTGEVIGMNVFKEVGVGRMAIGNGLGTTLSGLFGGNAYTTYGESTSFVMLSRYYNPNAQLWTALFFIVIAFVTPISKLIMCLPMEAFGGIITYLFSMIAINSLKSVVGSGVDLNDRGVFAVMTTMLAISSISFVIGGVAVSSVAIATVVGVILNAIIQKVKKESVA